MTGAQTIHCYNDPQTGPQSLDRAESVSLGSAVLILGAALILLGVLGVFSATAGLDRPLLPDNLFKSIAVRQAVFGAFGILAMWLTYAIGHSWLRWRGAAVSANRQDSLVRAIEPARLQPSALLLGFGTLCLLIVLLPGIGAERHGARRWVQFGPAQYGLGFQPSELAKFIVIIFLAAWLAHRRAVMAQFRRGILPAALLLGALAILIVVEDLGTAALIALVGGMMVIAAGARWWHALLLALPGLTLFGAMVYAKPYRIKRILSFTDIWSDPLGEGYHPIQSLVAIASGGWEGAGLGAGLQKYGYLPEARTDFIFAIICEEMGIIGGLAVVALFVCLVLVGWRIMVHAGDAFGKLLALGITLMIGFQAAMNIAVVTVSVPTKGISLPLISAGGSGVVLYSIALGLLASVAKVSARPPAVSVK